MVKIFPIFIVLAVCVHQFQAQANDESGKINRFASTFTDSFVKEVGKSTAKDLYTSVVENVKILTKSLWNSFRNSTLFRKRYNAKKIAIEMWPTILNAIVNEEEANQKHPTIKKLGTEWKNAFVDKYTNLLLDPDENLDIVVQNTLVFLKGKLAFYFGVDNVYFANLNEILKSPELKHLKLCWKYLSPTRKQKLADSHQYIQWIVQNNPEYVVVEYNLNNSIQGAYRKVYQLVSSKYPSFNTDPSVKEIMTNVFTSIVESYIDAGKIKSNELIKDLTLIKVNKYEILSEKLIAIIKELLGIIYLNQDWLRFCSMDLNLLRKFLDYQNKIEVSIVIEGVKNELFNMFKTNKLTADSMKEPKFVEELDEMWLKAIEDQGPQPDKQTLVSEALMNLRSLLAFNEKHKFFLTVLEHFINPQQFPDPSKLEILE